MRKLTILLLAIACTCQALEIKRAVVQHPDWEITHDGEIVERN